MSREEAAFFRPMKNFVRSVWDLMSLISPPPPLHPKKPPSTPPPPPPKKPPTNPPPPPPPPLCSRTEISKNTLNWQQKAGNETITTTTTKATKRSKANVKRKKYI